MSPLLALAMAVPGAGCSPFLSLPFSGRVGVEEVSGLISPLISTPPRMGEEEATLGSSPLSLLLPGGGVEGVGEVRWGPEGQLFYP